MKGTILIVEDEQALSNALKIKLEAGGYTVYTSNNGLDGLKTAVMRTPDILILDIIMPQMSGKEMYDKLQQTSWGKEVPIIILSNLDPSDIELAELRHNPQVHYHIKSNTHIDDIYKEITEILQKTPTSQ